MIIWYSLTTHIQYIAYGVKCKFVNNKMCGEIEIENDEIK